jgi:hypothetical protein
MLRATLLPFLITAILCGCSKITWSETMPKQLTGTWIQTSDDIVAGREKPAVLIVKQEGITHRWVDGDKYETYDYPFIKSNHDGSNVYIVFCGKKDSSTIASQRYRFTFKDDIAFAYVDDIVADGHGGDGAFTVGRFVRK